MFADDFVTTGSSTSCVTANEQRFYNFAIQYIADVVPAPSLLDDGDVESNPGPRFAPLIPGSRITALSPNRRNPTKAYPVCYRKRFPHHYELLAFVLLNTCQPFGQMHAHFGPTHGPVPKPKDFSAAFWISAAVVFFLAAVIFGQLNRYTQRSENDTTHIRPFHIVVLSWPANYLPRPHLTVPTQPMSSLRPPPLPDPTPVSYNVSNALQPLSSTFLPAPLLVGIHPNPGPTSDSDTETLMVTLTPASRPS